MRIKGVISTFLFPSLLHFQDSEAVRLMLCVAGEGACFQYMCYQWNVTTQFRWCSNSADCLRKVIRCGSTSSSGSVSQAALCVQEL